MSPRRGERAAPAPTGEEYDLRFASNLGTASWKGEALERWQYEVTSGGRVWYVIDDARRTAWITYAGTGHPKAAD